LRERQLGDSRARLIEVPRELRVGHRGQSAKPEQRQARKPKPSCHSRDLVGSYDHRRRWMSICTTPLRGCRRTARRVTLCGQSAATGGRVPKTQGVVR
jgi:hypothetical protein